MAARALDEPSLHPFLRRRRRRRGVIDVPAVGSLLAEALGLAAKLVPANAGVLLLDDPAEAPGSRTRLTTVAEVGEVVDTLGAVIPSNARPLGRVYHGGVTAAGRLRSPRSSHLPESFSGRPYVAAPVLLERTVCGVLVLAKRPGQGAFSAQQVVLVELFAQYVSRAILNAVDVLKQNDAVLFDDLTGLRSLRGLTAALATEVATARRTGRELALLFIDMDRLKDINDRLGHRAGAELLRRTGRIIRDTTRDRGLAFRFGGDEFVVLCPGYDTEGAVGLANEIRARVHARTRGPFGEGEHLPAATVSIGVASVSRTLDPRRRAAPSQAADRLLAAADRALYRAKRRGRNLTAFATRADDVLGRASRTRLRTW